MALEGAFLERWITTPAIIVPLLLGLLGGGGTIIWKLAGVYYEMRSLVTETRDLHRSVAKGLSVESVEELKAAMEDLQ